MTYRFNTALARNPAEAAYHLFRHAIDNLGWTAYYAGGGTGSGVSGAGLDPFATADDWGEYNNAYQCIREPAPGIRVLTFQRGSTVAAMAVYVSRLAASPPVPSGTEDTRPPLAEEQQLVGTGGSTKGNFFDQAGVHQLFLFGDDAPGGDYIEGTDSAVRYESAAHLLGFCARPYAAASTMNHRIFGMFPLNVWRGTDLDPVIYMEAWTGDKSSGVDWLGYYDKGGGAEAFLGTNNIKPYYFREPGGGTQPGTSAVGPFSVVTDFGLVSRYPIVAAKGGAATKFPKGVLQDLFWAQHGGQGATATFPSSIQLPSFTRGQNQPTYTNQDFLRVGDDLYIPWDAFSYPVQI